MWYFLTWYWFGSAWRLYEYIFCTGSAEAAADSLAGGTAATTVTTLTRKLSCTPCVEVWFISIILYLSKWLDPEKSVSDNLKLVQCEGYTQVLVIQSFTLCWRNKDKLNFLTIFISEKGIKIWLFKKNLIRIFIFKYFPKIPSEMNSTYTLCWYPPPHMWNFRLFLNSKK